ncbi:MAG: WD40 repeat domain-containing protein [Rhizonema sp. PD37]|nr:WD40 repeat domain-containing protein [Rhizonema sp. PD37]
MSCTVPVAVAPTILIPSAVTAEIQFTPNPASSGSINPLLVYIFTEHTGTVKSLAFSPDSKILASGGSQNDGIIRLWNMNTGKRAAIFRKAQKTAVESLLISPDSQTLASCSDDHTINIWNWNLKNKKYIFTRSFVGHTSNVLSLAITPDSKILVSGAQDGIRLWDMVQQRPLATLVRFDNIDAVAISPDGQLLASGDNKGLMKLWDLRSGKLIRTVSAHSDIVSAVAFTPDGNTLVSSSRDHTIKLWNVNTGELLRTLQENNWVNAIAINPSGQIIASGGKDGVKLWNLTTGELIDTLYAHSDWISAIAFSPDGKLLAAGGFDTRINIWRL